MNKFSKKVQSALGNYVYALVDPFTNIIFYVGKASSNSRAFDHLTSSLVEGEKKKKIEEIRHKGKEPVIEILRYGLGTPEIALEVEASIIDTIGIDKLTNVVRGHGIENGRLTLEEIERLYGSDPVEISEIEERYIMFFISRTYSTALSESELYDSTRQFWYGISEKARTRDRSGNFLYPLGLSVYDSVVIRVYRIEAWFRAGSTFSTRQHTDNINRWEFVGNLVHGHPIMGKKLTQNDEPIRSNQQGYGYIN